MTSGNGTVAVADYLFRGDAEVARALLDSQGIKAHVRADDEGGLNPGFFSEYRVVLEVSAADVGDARAVLGLVDGLVIPNEIRGGMTEHAQWAHPHEACGLLAGGDGIIEMVFCLSNRDASATRYTIDPREHYGAMRYAEGRGWDIVGAWHSHPEGDAVLSNVDLAQSPGGDWITVVVGNGPLSGPPIRAYRTDGAAVFELAVYESA
ncbi:Mov34/MPN/PAD-1 family protein [Actinomycetota bacterium]